MNRANSVKGKVVVVTGASSGIGEATANHLAELGGVVVLGARRVARLQQVASKIREAGGQAVVVETDVTKRQDSEKLLQTALERFGRVDVWVNNAGVMALAPMDRLKVDEWDRMIDVNIKGVLYGIAAALPQMRRQGAGHIINVASVAGLKIFSPIGTVYSATKFAVRALSEGLRAEAGPSLRVTLISPGAVTSELKDGSSDADTARFVSEFYRANEIPADAVARAIAYAIEQPADVDINEIVLRPTVQEF
ncbi:MAG: SDR family oxidoreductase [Gammaproteobacteria bacterium]|nr:SDR family oxidoreductase [Gammaproteobacteria bacterium]